jgi:hypothetical protein
MAAIQTLCTRAVMLEDGRVCGVGDTNTVLTRYLQRGGEDSDKWLRDAHATPKPLQFESARLRLEGQAPRQRLHLDLELATTAPHRPGFIAIDILNALGSAVMQAMPTVSPFVSDDATSHHVHVTIDLPPLTPGHYPVTMWVGSHFTETLDLVERALGFDIDTSPTPDRTFGHAPDHGYIVPASSYTYVPQSAPEPALA